MRLEPETIGRVPVTEEMIEAWADEAEAGYAPEQLHPISQKRQ